MELLQIILATIVTLGLLVTIHEYGHFWVARRCGVKVLRFSIGFGKPLVRWYDKAGTEFVIAAIPLGGYVKMLDEREGEVAPEERELAFNRKPVGQRIAIVVAGPAANFLFAIFAYWLMFLIGITTIVPVVGKVEPGSAAEQAGIAEGQEITRVDGTETGTWQSIGIQLLARIGDTGELSIDTRSFEGVGQSNHQIPLRTWLSEMEQPDPIAALGITPWRPPIPPLVDQVVKGGAAERGGLQSGDRVLGVNGKAISDWGELVAQVQASPGKSIELEIERQGNLIKMTFVPDTRELEDGRTVGYLGVAAVPVNWPESMRREVRYSFFTAWVPALEKTWNMTALTLSALKKMVMGLISIKNLSGPITIAKVAGASVKRGLESFLNFLAYLSITLGLINILPIPVLDGGHLMYYLVELVRGKPVSERIQMLGLRIGLSLILALMVLALYNDIMRL